MSDNHLLLKAIGQNPDLIEPFGNLIIVKLMEASDTSLGGIHLPDAVVSRDRQSLARVISVGKGQRNALDGQFMGCFCKPGDLVVVLKHAPQPIQLGGETCHVVMEGDIVGRVNEERLAPILETMETEAAEKAATAPVFDVGGGRQASVHQTESGILVAQTVGA
jgi:co-chaperonin GroES (HSP10)